MSYGRRFTAEESTDTAGGEEEKAMDYQWYPGHMTKARRMMQEDIRLVDLVIELIDARVPCSGRNPDLAELARGKARLVLLTKTDLADPAGNDMAVRAFQKEGLVCMGIDARKRNFVRELDTGIREACREKIERDRRRGIIGRPIRAMVVGIPNVGKSTLINSYAGKVTAKTGDRPGVTRGKQWIRPGKNLELLDTPGILWPRFDDPATGIRLALSGCIRDEVTDAQDLALHLISFLRSDYPGRLEKRYLAEPGGARSEGEPASAFSREMSDSQVLEKIAVCRSCLKRGAEPDLDRAARLLLEDFRSGKLGRVTLDPLKEIAAMEEK